MGLFDRFFGPLTQDKFAKIVAQSLRRCGDDRRATYDKANFRLLHTKEGKDAGVTNLVNLFKEYTAAPKEERSAMLIRVCKGFVNRMEMPDDFEDVKPDLLPSLRNSSMLEIMRLEGEIAGKPALDPVHLSLTDELVVCIVYDLPSSMRFIVQEDLAKWDIAFYQALEIAQQNLIEREFRAISLGTNLFIIETDDAYDGTRLLLKDTIRNMKLDGLPIAMPITRDCLLITGSEDVEGLGIMATLAQKKINDARPLLPIPLKLDGDEWEKWLPPSDHPHFRQFKELEVGYLYGEYAEQKKLLDQRNEQAGRDIFEATFSAMERDGVVVSYCAWTKGVVTSLPKTDYVGLFVPEPKSMRFVRWENLQKIAAEIMLPLNHHPPRWLVEDFPSEEQIAQMAVEHIE